MLCLQMLAERNKTPETSHEARDRFADTIASGAPVICARPQPNLSRDISCWSRQLVPNGDLDNHDARRTTRNYDNTRVVSKASSRHPNDSSRRANALDLDFPEIAARDTFVMCARPHQVLSLNP